MLADFAALRVPLDEARFDEHLSCAVNSEEFAYRSGFSYFKPIREVFQLMLRSLSEKVESNPYRQMILTR